MIDSPGHDQTGNQLINENFPLHHVPLDILGSLSPLDGDENYYENRLVNGLISKNPHFVIDYCMGKIEDFEEVGDTLLVAFQEFTHQLLSRGHIDGSHLISAWHSHRNKLCQQQEVDAFLSINSHPDDPSHIKNGTSSQDRLRQVVDQIPWEKMEIFASENPYLKLNHSKGHAPHYPSQQLLRTLHKKSNPYVNSPQNNRATRNISSPISQSRQKIVSSPLNNIPSLSLPTTQYVASPSVKSNSRSVPIPPSGTLYGGLNVTPNLKTSEIKTPSSPIETLHEIANYHNGSRPVKWPGSNGSTWTASKGPVPFPWRVDGSLETSLSIMAKVIGGDDKKVTKKEFDMEQSPSYNSTSKNMTGLSNYNHHHTFHLQEEGGMRVGHKDCLNIGVSPFRKTDSARVRDGRNIKVVPILDNLKH